MDYLHIVLLSIIVILVGYAVFSFFFYRKKSTEWNFAINEYAKALRDRPTIPMNERISSMQNLFAMIDMLIDYSIMSDREYEILLQKKSKKIDLEDAVSRISEYVFHSLNPSVFGDVNNIVTDDCLMHYIQQKTFVEYFIYIQKNYEGMDE